MGQYLFCAVSTLPHHRRLRPNKRLIMIYQTSPNVKHKFQKNQNFFETCREVFSGADRVLHFMRGWGGIIITRKENSGRCLWPGRRSFSQHGAAIQAASRAKGQQGRTAGYQRTYPPLAAGRSRGVKAGTEPGGAWWRESIIAASHAARTGIGLEQRG